MAPPALTYTRELRLSIDVIIRLTPQATGIGVVHSRGHIFLLSDLFLVCERMTPEERLQYVSGGPDMWLRYPPLAGKVLRVSEVAGQGWLSILDLWWFTEVMSRRQCCSSCDHEKRDPHFTGGDKRRSRFHVGTI